MKKLPKCKKCGETGHYAYKCYKTPPEKPLKRSVSPPKTPSKRKTVKLPRNTTKSRKTLVNRLDGVVSQYVRLKYANKQGIVRCYTCGRSYLWKDIDNGHFWSRRYMPTRFDPENCRPQCQFCNREMGGNYNVYSRKMFIELGKERYENLERKAKSGEKISTPMLEVMLEKAEQALIMLKEQRNQK